MEHCKQEFLKGGWVQFWKEVVYTLMFCRNGIFPLTAFKLPTPPPKPRAKTPEVEELSKSDDPEPVDVENRLVMQSSCSVKKTDEEGKCSLTLQLKMDDKMNRQLTADINEEDTPENLAQELVHYGFINQVCKILEGVILFSWTNLIFH